MEEKLRRHRNNLAVAGIGIIIFGLWSTIKSLMFFTLAPNLTEALAEAAKELPEMPDNFYFILFYGLIGSFLAVDIILRLIVGLSARAEGKGKKKGMGYLIVGTLLLISSASSFLPTLPAFFASTGSHVDAIMTTVIELTSMFTLGQLLYSAIQTKLLVKTLENTAR